MLQVTPRSRRRSNLDTFPCQPTQTSSYSQTEILRLCHSSVLEASMLCSGNVCCSRQIWRRRARNFSVSEIS
ncbi:hypothetical protein Plhal703r1_c27g0109941 [Plasmopara halstedii]